MARIIPNENTFIAFDTVRPANLSAPTAAEITAATDLTSFCISVNASSQGNTVPTPALDSLFETNVPGTSSATFQADFYRDDESDDAWTTLERGLEGVFYISRFGGSGTNNKPIAADIVEVWPVVLISRTAGALTSNTAQTFTCNAAVPIEPDEAAVVAA